MPRTIVVSDLHGSRAALERVLEHAGFGDGDRLVVAGDLVDVGSDDTVGFAESLGATILAGNHEVSAALGLRIAPQNVETLLRGPEFAERMLDGRWKLAVEVDGWLVTHAGVSVALDDLVARAGYDAGALALDLNERFRRELAAAREEGPLEWQDMERYRLVGGELGPLWFRPTMLSRIPSGLRQIVGHTPPDVLGDALVTRLESYGWLLVESGGHGAAHVRYAVVEPSGEAHVVVG
ncbi:MAG: hypothetical protein FDZ75_04850 [Actinobacteria bacterium]|nr:MAG: hypothetical protein FDZ75_04850 [Actinomycetota bacterium]